MVSMKIILYKFFYMTIVVAGLIFISQSVPAQDPHFSQFGYTPLQLNPALTGIFNGNTRISNTYRSQWSGLGNGYKTIYISVDGALGKEKMQNNYFGIGGLVYQDKAGTSGFKSTFIQGSLSYNTALDDQSENFFSIGFQIGINQSSIDLTKATWDSQWNGDVFDPLLSSGETIQLQQFSYTDFNAGVLYYYIPNDYNTFNIGASMSHVGSPNVSFYTFDETPLRRKITLHSSGEINIDKSYQSWIEPKLLVVLQGKQKEIMAGGYFKNKLQLKSRYTNYLKEAYFYGGAFYRLDDAVVFSARFEFNTLGIGLSYDINTSSLSKLSGSSNAFEISLSYVSYVKRGSRAKNYQAMPRYF